MVLANTLVADHEHKGKPSNAEVMQKTHKLQMPFIANEGQLDERVAFYARTFGGTVFVTKDGDIVYSLPMVAHASSLVHNEINKGKTGYTGLTGYRGKEGLCIVHRTLCTLYPYCTWNFPGNYSETNFLCHSERSEESHLNNSQSEIRSPKSKISGIALREEFIGAKVSGIKGEGESVTKVSYFKGNDPSKWKSNISTYELVNLGEIYDGIELKLKAHGNNVEKLLYVKPGAVPEQIKISLSGMRDCGVQNAECETVNPKLQVNEHGELVAETELGLVKFTKPIAYQIIDGKRVEIECGYVISDYGITHPLPLSRGEYKSPLLGEKYKSPLLGGDLGVGNFEIQNSQPETRNPKSTNSNSTNPKLVVSEVEPSKIQDVEAEVSNPKSKIVNRKFEYGFTVASYDRTKDLVIDPLLASTYLGGSGDDEGYSLTLDTIGNVYVTGRTFSTNFPTTSGAYDTSHNIGDSDVFVSKLDSGLTSMLASTFLGGSSTDIGYSLTLDTGGNVYVTGYAQSSDFPTTSGAYNTSFNGAYDVFVSKLDGGLTSLLASTYLGGPSTDIGRSLTLDTSGNVYVTGYTVSPDFPTTSGAYDTSHNGGRYYGDVFVSKLDSGLASMLASTYLGGSNDDIGYSLTLDTGGNVYVTGYTDSTDFPTTTGAYDTSLTAGSVAFISKLDGGLTTLLASTLLGGSGDVRGYSLSLDTSGNIYVTGLAASPDFPTTSGAYDTSFNGGYDAFVSKLDSGLTSLLASTFLGGSSEAWSYSLSLDTNGHVYVTGFTTSPDFPTTSEAYDTSLNGGYDVFVSKLDSGLTRLLASTFLGGSSYDFGYYLTLDTRGNVYVTGGMSSQDFPTTSGAYDTSYNGNVGSGYADVFVSKLDGNLSDSSKVGLFDHFSFSTISSPQTVGVPFEVTITAKDAYGNTVTGFSGEVILSASIGRVNPTKTNLTNGSKTLSLKLDSPGNNIRIQANGNGKSGESNSFHVTGGATNIASICGIVKDSTGSRVSGATVHLNGDTATTDNNGAYQFENLTPGEYTIKSSLYDKESMSFKISLSTPALAMDLDLLSKYTTDVTPILLVPGILGSSTEDLYPTLPPMCLAWNSSKWIKNGWTLYHGMLDPGVPWFSQEVGWKSLVEALHSNDSRYEIGTTIFPVPYDWRMRIDDIANGYLKPWIDEAKKRTGVPKVNIIAHSMGGLVTRAYIQSSGYENDIDKFAMVGTPNHGAGIVYYIWEGGDPSLADDLNETKLYSKVFDNIYKEINSGKPLPMIDTEVRDFVRDYVPSIRQLLPTYLVLQSGNTIKYIKDTDSINNDLFKLNENLNMKGVNAKIFAGTNQDTISIINVGQPNDAPNALYRDGRPLGKPDEVKMGDGNVLLTSASLLNVSSFSPEKNGIHASLIKTYINDLVEFITGIKLSETVANSTRLKTRNALDETTSLNGLVISVRGRVQPYIVDPQDRKSGINPTTNLREEEIPNSIISVDGDGGSIGVENAVNGIYTVYLKDAYYEDYRLILSYVDNEKTVQKEYLGFNHANTTSFTFTIDSTSEDRLTVNHTPLPPIKLQADAVDAGGLKTKLTWDASTDPDVTGYNIYSREDDEPYLAQIGSTADVYYDTTHDWAENSTIKTRIYAVSAVKADGTESFLSDMVENNDRDHDGLKDEQEVALGTDVNKADTDGDGLKDGEEYVYGTNPLLTDTDGDGYSDYDEIRNGSDPLDKDSIPNGLESHYTFNEGTGNIAHDLSGNGNDGTINGATWAAGKNEGGLSFDGINDSVSIPRMNNDEISISAWFYKNTNDTTRVDAIFGGFRNSSNAQLRGCFDLRFSPGAPNTLEFILVTQDGSGIRTTKTTQRNLHNAVGSWYHAVGTYNKATGEQKLYVNGEPVHAQTHLAGNTVVPLAFYPDMRIGYSRVNNGYFHGVIDDVRLYNRVLSGKEIKDLYHAFTADLQAQYNLDEGVGTIAGDASGNGNHGRINGGAKWTTGRYGGGLKFDGTNDYVSIPRGNHDQVSVCAWFNKKANDKVRNDAVFGGYRNNSNIQLREGLDVRFPSNAPNTLQFVLVTQDGNGLRTARTAQWNLKNSVGSWRHLAGTYDKATGKQRLYVNGVLVNTQTHPAGNTIVPLTKYPDMRIGYSRVNAGYFKGVIDDARIYNRALTDQEVQDIYNNP